MGLRRDKRSRDRQGAVGKSRSLSLTFLTFLTFSDFLLWLGFPPDAVRVASSQRRDRTTGSVRGGEGHEFRRGIGDFGGRKGNSVKGRVFGEEDRETMNGFPILGVVGSSFKRAAVWRR